MKLATFNKDKDRFDTNNPYDAFIKQAAKRTKVPDELRTRKVYIGKSAAGLATPDKHHFLERSLFPKKGTPTIKISALRQTQWDEEERGDKRRRKTIRKRERQRG